MSVRVKVTIRVMVKVMVRVMVRVTVTVTVRVKVSLADAPVAAIAARVVALLRAEHVAHRVDDGVAFAARLVRVARGQVGVARVVGVDP